MSNRFFKAATLVYDASNPVTKSGTGAREQYLLNSGGRQW